MWIKRDDFVAKERENARLLAEVELNQKQIQRLQREIDYWRGKFEEAQNRADRVNDKLTETAGFGPVSELGVKEAEKMKKEYQRMMVEAERQNREMFSEEGEFGVDENLASALVKGLNG